MVFCCKKFKRYCILVSRMKIQGFIFLEGQQVPILVGWHLFKFPNLKFMSESLGFEEQSNNTFRKFLDLLSQSFWELGPKYCNLTLDIGICYVVRTARGGRWRGKIFEWLLKCKVSDNKSFNSEFQFPDFDNENH